MANEESDAIGQDTNLVPVFIPPLAAMLAHAEELKGTRLEELEVERVRDNAVCIMMATEDAAKLAESRGYFDVEPENCWADWHRLRVQLTGRGHLPKIVLCVLGDADFESRCRRLLEADEIEHEWHQHDGRMMAAFQASVRRCDPSLTEKDIASIANHSRVLYVLSDNFTARDGPTTSQRFLALGRNLIDAGAFAMKCDSSGVAHGRDRWVELASAAEGADPWSALFRAYVQLPVCNGEDYYTCGLHLLGQPDLIASAAVFREAYDSANDLGWAAVELFHNFARYLLAECAPGQFASGHTFALSATAPRFRVRWEACTGYEDDDFFFNPFGRWRFTEFVR